MNESMMDKKKIKKKEKEKNFTTETELVYGAEVRIRRERGGKGEGRGTRRRGVGGGEDKKRNLTRVAQCACEAPEFTLFLGIMPISFHGHVTDRREATLAHGRTRRFFCFCFFCLASSALGYPI